MSLYVTSIMYKWKNRQTTTSRQANIYVKRVAVHTPNHKGNQEEVLSLNELFLSKRYKKKNTNSKIQEKHASATHVPPFTCFVSISHHMKI